jgi:hypothetical protein
MENTRFENMARTLGRGLTRRAAVRELMTGAAAVIAGGVVLTHDADAKRRRKKGRKSKKQTQRFLAPGEFCSSNSQCNGGKGYICAVASNAGNSDKTCSGGTGAVCGAPNADGDATAPFCAAGFQCVNGICQPAV